MVTGFTECFATKSSHHRRLAVQGNAVQAYGADLREVAPGMQQADLPRRAEITAYVVRERCGTARQGDLKGESPSALARARNQRINPVNVRHLRARRPLRKEMERVCRTCATHGYLDCDCACA